MSQEGRLPRETVSRILALAAWLTRSRPFSMVSVSDGFPCIWFHCAGTRALSGTPGQRARVLGGGLVPRAVLDRSASRAQSGGANGKQASNALGNVVHTF